MYTNIKARFEKITTFVLDVDGVMTDGKIMICETGHFVRTMNVRDGFAKQHAIKQGYQIFVISGGVSPAVEQRLRRLGIQEVFMGIQNKLETMQNLLKKYDLTPEKVIYVGDDLPDIEAIQLAGIKCCPADAVPEIMSIADFVSTHKGGEGCVREIIEQVLRVQGKWRF